MDNKKSDRPERRTALVGQVLQRYDIDIAALSETRLADTGEITEFGAGYTFVWSGKTSDERREAGVGFAFRTSLVMKLESLPKGISDRLMVMRLPLKGKKHLTLISAYAPTMSYTKSRRKCFIRTCQACYAPFQRITSSCYLGTSMLVWARTPSLSRMS